MAEASMVPGAVQAADRGRFWVLVYLATTGLVLILMMIFGLLMRLSQSGWLVLDPALFYQLLPMPIGRCRSGIRSVPHARFSGKCRPVRPAGGCAHAYVPSGPAPPRHEAAVKVLHDICQFKN